MRCLLQDQVLQVFSVILWRLDITFLPCQERTDDKWQPPFVASQAVLMDLNDVSFEVAYPIGVQTQFCCREHSNLRISCLKSQRYAYLSPSQPFSVEYGYHRSFSRSMPRSCGYG